MSVAGISSTSLSSYNSPTVQNSRQQLQQQFQMLGQDLQSGNLSAAQSALASLQQSAPQPNSAALSQSNNPIAQEFSQLSTDLQSGNVAAAKQDYSTIQQDSQNQATSLHHHHHQAGGSEASAMSQGLQELGQALQSGNLSSAQQAYSALQQDLPSGQANAQQTQSLLQLIPTGISVSA
jgi:outer membrane protein assembly factor BamD (BamD/ComL family)